MESVSINKIKECLDTKNVQFCVWNWDHDRGSGMLLAKFNFGPINDDDIKCGITPMRKLSSFKTIDEFVEYLILEAELYGATDLYFSSGDTLDCNKKYNSAFLMRNKIE